MSWYGTLPEIPGFVYPGSHIYPDGDALRAMTDAALVGYINVDEGTSDEVTSRFLRLSLFPAPRADGVDVLLGVEGCAMLADQLVQFILWRYSKGDRRATVETHIVAGLGIPCFYGAMGHQDEHRTKGMRAYTDATHGDGDCYPDAYCSWCDPPADPDEVRAVVKDLEALL